MNDSIVNKASFIATIVTNDVVIHESGSLSTFVTNNIAIKESAHAASVVVNHFAHWSFLSNTGFSDCYFQHYNIGGMLMVYLTGTDCGIDM